MNKYGSGSGSGFGFGYGYGSGDGSGSGSGYGSGDGSGYGSGDGSGYGYGDGYGYGYGDGDGVESYHYSLAVLDSFKRPGKRIAFWKSDSRGCPANGGIGGPVAVGMVQKVSGPLELCGKRALHGTLSPSRWKGDRLWVVALSEPVEEEDDKMGSLEREIIAEIPNFSASR